MMELIVFLAALLLIAISYKLGTGDWFHIGVTEKDPVERRKRPPAPLDETSTMATSIGSITK